MWAGLQAGASFALGMEANEVIAQGAVRNLRAAGYTQGVDFEVVVADATKPFDLGSMACLPEVEPRWFDAPPLWIKL